MPALRKQSWLRARARSALAFSVVMVPLSACTVADKSDYTFRTAAGGSALGGGPGAGGSMVMSGLGGASGSVATGGVSSAMNSGGAAVAMGGSFSMGGQTTPGSGGSGEASGGSGGAVVTEPTTVAKMCPVGEHLCVDACVKNSDVRTCGASCSPCETPPDGMATCDGERCGAACPNDKKLCLGACIALSAACVGVCPVGSHACEGSCPVNTSVNACGTACAPCPVPAGASQATCDGTKCDFQCQGGYHRCGNLCVLDTDTGACGSACSVCPSATGGTAKCLDGTCAIECAAGSHLCGKDCASDTSANSCGQSCEPCVAPAGGTATCVSGKCGGTCPSGQKLCAGACIASNAACEGTCPAGSHDCSGLCLSNTSTSSCGAACGSCPLPVGAAQATCDGTKCDFTCGNGYHRCGTRCASDSDATACASNCSDCPDDPNGTATCSGGQCGLRCASATHHACDGKCVANNDKANCGPSSCSPCQTPTNGSVTCDGLACVPGCTGDTKLCVGACIPTSVACNGMCEAPGTHPCSGVCVSNTSVDSCGALCTSCPKPQGGSSTCSSAGKCGVSCPTNTHPCNDNSVCADNNAIATCGSSCTACAPPANSTATCDGKSCGFTCKASHLGANCQIPRFELVPLPTGTTTSWVAEISADGSVVVGSMGSPQVAYRWPVSEAKATALSLCTGATSSSAAATNSTGSIVVGSCGGKGFHFTAPSTMKAIPGTSDWNYWPSGVSSNGNTVSGNQIEDTDPYFAFVWMTTAAAPTRIITIESSAEAISGDGTVIVGNQRPNGGIRQAIWYTSGRGLQILPGNATLHSGAYGISTGGTYIVGYVGATATRWSGNANAGYTTQNTLPPLPSSGSAGATPYDVSDDGSVVVGTSLVAASTYEAVVWTNGNIQRLSELVTATGLSLGGATLTSAVSVSGDGKAVVGTANLNGVARAYIVRLP